MTTPEWVIIWRSAHDNHWRARSTESPRVRDECERMHRNQGEEVHVLIGMPECRFYQETPNSVRLAPAAVSIATEEEEDPMPLYIDDPFAFQLMTRVEGERWKQLQLEDRQSPCGFFAFHAAFQLICVLGDRGKVAPWELIEGGSTIYGEGGLARYSVTARGEIVLDGSSTHGEKHALAGTRWDPHYPLVPLTVPRIAPGVSVAGLSARLIRQPPLGGMPPVPGAGTGGF